VQDSYQRSPRFACLHLDWVKFIGKFRLGIQCVWQAYRGHLAAACPSQASGHPKAHVEGSASRLGRKVRERNSRPRECNDSSSALYPPSTMVESSSATLCSCGNVRIMPCARDSSRAVSYCRHESGSESRSQSKSPIHFKLVENDVPIPAPPHFDAIDPKRYAAMIPAPYGL